MPKKFRSNAMAAIHETASDLEPVGGMDQKTMRQFDALCLTPIQEMTPQRIRALRTRENASQTVFAAYLNVTPSLVSKWERGESTLRGLSQAPVSRRKEGFRGRGLEALSGMKGDSRSADERRSGPTATVPRAMRCDNTTLATSVVSASLLWSVTGTAAEYAVPPAGINAPSSFTTVLQANPL